MQLEEYEQKLTDMLSDEKTYKELQSEPTAHYKRELIAILSRLKKEAKISHAQYHHFFPTVENVLRIYSTPKVHKPGNKVRPIVDYTGSIGYNTSRALADILAPLVGKTDHHVENSKPLANDLAQVYKEEGEIFNSHDIVSLFTDTLVDKSLKVIKQRLLQDKTLKQRTLLLVDDIMELLRFTFQTTSYFSFRGKIYQQLFGAAMGSPASPITCNLYMEFLEQEAIATTPLDFRPRLWKRYVDDTLEIVKDNKVENLTDYLNNTDPSGSILWERD